MALSEDEVLQQLLETNSQLVAMMTSDDETDIEINGQLYPSLRKYAKSILMGDMQSLADDVTQKYNDTVTIYNNIVSIESQINTTKSQIDDIKLQIDTIKQDIDDKVAYIDQIASDTQALYNQSVQLKTEIEILKQDIQDYKSQIATKLQEIEQSQTLISQLEVRARRHALEAQAAKLQAGEYANKTPGELVNCWTVGSDDVVIETTSTCEYSTRHWYELVKSYSKDLLQTCYEYVPLELVGKGADTLCVIGSPTDGDEHIDLTLTDGTKSQVFIRGNYLSCKK